MAKPTIGRSLGNSLVVQFDDNSQATAVPIHNGYYLFGELVGGGSGTGTGGGGSGTVGDPGNPIDDYPWPTSNTNNVSPLGYDYRQCVDFVAWRLNRDAGVVASPWKYTYSKNLRPAVGGNGDAIGWKHDWELNGWAVNIQPVVGCVAWFSTEVGALGHVAYVQAVHSDGTVLLEQYNWGSAPIAYSTRTCDKSVVDSFLAVPPR